jgi:elongation factor P--(R)-beta-lysine ligase
VTTFLGCDIIEKRSLALKKVRRFFEEKDLCEVDPFHLVPYSSLDTHIALFHVENGGYLHSSPELMMKKLLGKYKKDIYFLGHVFRKEEQGSKHLCEFTMIEWYRIDFTLNQMIQESVELLGLFFPNIPAQKMRYCDAFMKYTGINPMTASAEELQNYLRTKNTFCHAEAKEDLLDLILSLFVEPHLGNDSLTVITHYPADQAALSNVFEEDGLLYASRFEIYFKGTELANGYHELRDPMLLKKRFLESNRIREKNNQELLAITDDLIQGLTHFPDASGVSIGFDRVLMLYLNLSDISQIYP